MMSLSDVMYDLEIDLTAKGDKDYHIVLHCYHPEMQEHTWTEDYDTKWGVKKTVKSVKLRPMVGSLSRIGSYNSLDDAIKSARELWQSNYKGAMKEIRIYPFEWGQPVMLFHSDNFKKFKQIDSGAPF